MATDFHFFPLLPWELREMIRKFAIRPALPGAHVVRVYTVREAQAGPEYEACHEATCSTKPWIFDSRLAAPRCLPRGGGFDPAAQAAAPISWTLNNPSTYLIDSGLWSACKESLQVIKKELQNPARQEKTWSPSKVESFRKKPGRFTLPETATYRASDNSSHRYFTVFPNQDLFILQPHDLSAIKWDFMWELIPSYRFRFGDWRQTLSGDGTGKRNMALEYNPAWDKAGSCTGGVDGKGPVWDFIYSLLWSTTSAEPFTLWFIDYRIKRNPRYQELEASEGDDAPRFSMQATAGLSK